MVDVVGNEEEVLVLLCEGDVEGVEEKWDGVWKGVGDWLMGEGLGYCCEKVCGVELGDEVWGVWDLVMGW